MNHHLRQTRHDSGHASSGSPRTANPLTLLATPQEALQAAQRLYDQSNHGFRFCCEHREVLNLEEAKARDAQEARRKRATSAELLRHESENFSTEPDVTTSWRDDIDDLSAELSSERGGELSDDLDEGLCNDLGDAAWDFSDDAIVSLDTIEDEFDYS